MIQFCSIGSYADKQEESDNVPHFISLQLQNYVFMIHISENIIQYTITFYNVLIKEQILHVIYDWEKLLESSQTVFYIILSSLNRTIFFFLIKVETTKDRDNCIIQFITHTWYNKDKCQCGKSCGTQNSQSQILFQSLSYIVTDIIKLHLVEGQSSLHRTFQGCQGYTVSISLKNNKNKTKQEASK